MSDLSQAKRNPKWTGRVYSDQYKRFFQSAYDFTEQFNEDWRMDPFLTPPPYVWAAVKKPIVHLDVEAVLSLLDPSAAPNGINELTAAITAFNAANPAVKLVVDRSTIVPIEWTDAPPPPPTSGIMTIDRSDNAVRLEYEAAQKAKS